MSDISIGIHLPGLAAAKKGLAGLRDDFDRLGKSKGAASILQGVGMSAGLAAWGALDSAISTVVDQIGQSIEAASNLRESMSLSEQVFEDSTDAVEKWAEATDDAFSKREALNFAAQFGTAFKNVGFAMDDVVTKSEEMATLAGDLGSAFNASSEEAATALRSGLLGESEPLRRFGVFLDEAKVKAKAMAMGMVAVDGKLTDSQKVMARYALILEQTADSQGMFGRDSGSLADAQKSLAATFEDLQAEIGEELLPVMVDLATWARDEGIPMVRGLKDGLGDLGQGFGMLGGFVDYATMDMTNFHDETAKGVGKIDRSSAAVKRLGREADGAANDIAGLTEAGEEVAEAYGGMRDAIRDAAKTLGDQLYGEEEIRLKRKGNRLELQELNKEIRKLERTKHRTPEQEQELNGLKLDLIDNKREAIDLKAAMDANGEVTLDQTKGWIDQLTIDTSEAGDEAKRLYEWLAKIEAIGGGGGGGGKGGSGSHAGAQFAADGGTFYPGDVVTVGEEGRETMLVGPGSATIIPNSGSGGGGGGSAVVIQLVMDGRVVSEVVDRHLYYEAARAPQSPYAG